jgi:sulfate/thiosulfate transport system permease protein
MNLALMRKKPKTQPGLWLLRVPSILFLVLIVIIPLVVIFQDGFREGFSSFQYQVTLPIAKHAILLTLWTSALMTVINAVMGLVTAYVLVRYDFPGKRLLNAIVDLPLAIPTLVTGIMLVILYGPQQSLGSFMIEKLDFRIVFAPPGIVLSLLFITFPFVVRTIQPILEELDRSQELAAATLGANPWRIFQKIILPALILPTLGGSLLSFSRAVGEFGAVVIVAGNIPLRTQTAAVYVFSQVESENRLGASAVSILLILVSFAVLWIANTIHKYWGAHR